MRFIYECKKRFKKREEERKKVSCPLTCSSGFYQLFGIKKVIISNDELQD